MDLWIPPRRTTRRGEDGCARRSGSAALRLRRFGADGKKKSGALRSAMALRSARSLPAAAPSPWDTGRDSALDSPVARRCESAPLTDGNLHAGREEGAPGGGAARPPGPERVPGLRAALFRAGMGSRIAEAESWCEEMGAVYLSECEENIEELAGALLMDADDRRAFLDAVAPRDQRSKASRRDPVRLW